MSICEQPDCDENAEGFIHDDMNFCEGCHLRAITTSDV